MQTFGGPYIVACILAQIASAETEAEFKQTISGNSEWLATTLSHFSWQTEIVCCMPTDNCCMSLPGPKTIHFVTGPIRFIERVV